MSKWLYPGLVSMCMLPACTDTDIPVEVTFVPRFGDQAIGCTSAAGSLSMTDLRFYVSELQFARRDGRRQALALPDDGSWQTPSLGLVDLEDGQGRCRNGTRDVRASLTGTLPQGDYRGLSFTLGVPFELNHANPLRASPPLDDSAMHWHWRSGYKFLRAGVETDTAGFWRHLGSAGCEGTVRNISGCRFPNRVRVHLPDFEPGRHVVVFDFAELLVETGLLNGDAGDAGNCSSGPGEEACRAPYEALGLDFEHGNATSNPTANPTTSPQRVFRSSEP